MSAFAVEAADRLSGEECSERRRHFVDADRVEQPVHVSRIFRLQPGRRCKAVTGLADWHLGARHSPRPLTTGSGIARLEGDEFHGEVFDDSAGEAGALG